MAFSDPMFQLGMVLTLPYRRKDMSRTNDLYDTIENLVYQSIEDGAKNVWDIYGYVTQYIPSSYVSHEMIESIVDDYDSFEETNNVTYQNLSW